MPFWQTAVRYHGSGRTDGAGRTEYFLRTACGFCEYRISVRMQRDISPENLFYDFRTSGERHLPCTIVRNRRRKKQQSSLLLSPALACISGQYHRTAGILVPVCCTGVVCRTGYSCRNNLYDPHILNIAVGLTFSGGLLDFFLFGILQGNEKTSWMRVIPVGILYFFLYYFIFKFMIKKFDF